MCIILCILPCLKFLSQLDFRDFNEAALFGMDIEFHVTTIQLTGVEREIGTFGEKKALRIPLFAISTYKLSPVENFSKSIQNRFFCWSVSLNQKCNLGLSCLPLLNSVFAIFCSHCLAFGDISDARNKWIFQDVSSSSSSSKSRTASLHRTEISILGH